MNNLLLLPALAMLIEGKVPPTWCDIVNWSLPMNGLKDIMVINHYPIREVGSLASNKLVSLNKVWLLLIIICCRHR